MARWRTRHRGSRPERGAAAVEFAIVLVVLLLIIFAIIDFGRLLFAVQGMKSASREGARTAAVRACWSQTSTACGLTSTTVATAITSAGSGAASLAGGTLEFTGTQAVTRTQDDTGSTTQLCTAAGPSVTVTASSSFTWFTPFFLFAPPAKDVSATTVMRCE